MTKTMLFMAVYWYVFVAIAGVAVAFRLLMGMGES